MRKALRLCAFILVLAALTSCSLFDYSNIVVHKYAFVYGVTMYSASGAVGNPNLSYPDKDASSVASLLSSQGYTVYSRWVDGSGNIYVNGAHTAGHTVGSPQYNSSGVFSDPGYTTGDAPTRGNIIGDIAGHASAIGPNDVVLVYFSGHGTQDTSATPSREYFIPYEGVSYFNNLNPTGFYADIYANPPNCVVDSDLASAFDAIKTPRKVLILDTCNSGGFIGNQLEVDWTPQAVSGQLAFVSPATLIAAIANYASMQASPTGLSPYGAQVLSAAGRDESSFEAGSPFFHGIMTYYLLLGLQGNTADLNQDGHVTVLEAFAYAKAGVEKNWNAVEGSSRSFEPHASGGPVDFVLF